MATQDKDFKVKNGLQVGGPTNLVNYSSASPSNPFIGQLWINEPYLYAWSSASTWVLVGDGNSGGGGGGSASGTPLNIPNTLVSRSASGTFSIGAIDIDTSASPALAVGRLQWNQSFGTPEIGLIGGNVSAHIGQHVHAYVTNAEGSPLVKGDVVYLFGASGDRASVKKAINTGDPTSSKTLGVVAEAIGTNQNGFVTEFGVVDGLNLSAYSPGDTLWLSASAGKFTNIKPSAPNHTVFIGVVERANAGNGQLFVNVQNGYELEELHNVAITNAEDNDIISYNQSASLWLNQNLATAITEVDGAGSGIDADLLDGQHGAYYQDAAGASATYLRIDTASSTYLSITNAEQSYIPISASYRTFDADKLDGYDESYFINTSSATQIKSGDLEVKNLIVDGVLYVSGSVTINNTTVLEVEDPLIYLSVDNQTDDLFDIGFIGAYGTISASHQHTGLIRDTTDKKWKLVSGFPHPELNLVDFTSAQYDTLVLGGVEVNSGNIQFSSSANGIVLKSPNNTSYLITVENDGSLKTTEL